MSKAIYPIISKIITLIYIIFILIIIKINTELNIYIYLRVLPMFLKITKIIIYIFAIFFLRKRHKVPHGHPWSSSYKRLCSSSHSRNNKIFGIFLFIVQGLWPMRGQQAKGKEAHQIRLPQCVSIFGISLIPHQKLMKKLRSVNPKWSNLSLQLM